MYFAKDLDSMHDFGNESDGVLDWESTTDNSLQDILNSGDNHHINHHNVNHGSTIWGGVNDDNHSY